MFENASPYEINSEYYITQIMQHFDSNYIFDMLNDKLDNMDYSILTVHPNIVSSFETNFKVMRDQFPGDSANINSIRDETYSNIIKVLTSRFNLEFNTVDDSIDKYTAAYCLYEFLVSKRYEIMNNFFTLFIMNNKDSLYSALNLDGMRKNKDSSSTYSKKIYTDNKIAIISANMSKVINYISTMDISLLNIFQSTYKDYNLVQFLDNAFKDRGNFFKQFYCDFIIDPNIMPIMITNIRLRLSSFIGDSANTDMQNILNSIKSE